MNEYRNYTNEYVYKTLQIAKSLWLISIIHWANGK